MSVIMKNVVSIIATLLLLVAASVQSAFAGQPPVEGAVPMGSFEASFGMEKNGPDLVYSTTNDGGGVVSTEVWMIGSGEIVYTVDVSSAQFYMPCGWAKKIEMPALMDMFSRAAIEKGIELGFTHCDGSCGGNVAKVYYPTCVKRDNAPECPHLESSPDSDYSMNAYDVCCATGTPELTLLYKVCGLSDCGGGFERTCF